MRRPVKHELTLGKEHRQLAATVRDTIKSRGSAEGKRGRQTNSLSPFPCQARQSIFQLTETRFPASWRQTHLARQVRRSCNEE
jgi:hypothetical protein